MLELRMVGEEVDGEDVEANGNTPAMACGSLGEIGRRQAAQLALFGRVDLGLGREEVAGGAGLDLEDHEGVPIPGDEIEIAANASGDPAAGDNGIAERAEIKEGVVFAEFAGKKVRRSGAVAPAERAEGVTTVGQRTQTEVGSMFEREKTTAQAKEAHGPGL